MKICFCSIPCDSVATIQEILVEELYSNTDSEYVKDSDELLKSITSGDKFDVVFLYTNSKCIETGKAVKALLPNVFLLFIADSSSYAVQAYECDAFYYLLENDSRERYISALKKMYRAYVLSDRRYLISCKQGTVCMDIFDIDYVECRIKHTVFHVGRQEYAVRQPIHSVMEVLGDLFIQVHQGFAVNPLKIQIIQKNDVVLKDGRSIMMAIRKRKQTIELFKKRIEIFKGC